MDFELKGKRALVTGGSQGIGKGIAAALAAEGASVAICARDLPRATLAAKEIAGASKGEVHAFQCDVTDKGAIETMFDSIRKLWGGVDILVNNAGAAHRKEFLSTDETDWELSYAFNVLSMVRCAQHALPKMLEGGYGRIVNVAAIAGREPVNGTSLSNTTKAAIFALSKSLALEFGAKGVLTNCIVPGRISTPQIDRMFPDPEARKKYAEQMIPLGRFGETVEAGSLVAFLCSPRASYLNGTVINVDGGMTKSIL
jgi:3-oxoacyl-[acyl-carrier protein] reductase